MFSGLNKYIKLILPKRLFYRALIIVAANNNFAIDNNYSFL